MRAAKKTTTKEQTSASTPPSQLGDTETVEPITRISPLRVSTIVSIVPLLQIPDDFGVMARQEGYPVLYKHQLYRTTLQGMFSLDLHACGTFSYRQKAGYRNLDAVRTEVAVQHHLEHLEEEKAYRLPFNERIRRIQGLFEGLALIEGGAKQALHYTDVTPAFSIMAVTRGGNHIFGHIVGANNKGLPEIKLEALREALTTMRDEILSPVCIGWIQGYLDEERKRVEQFITEFPTPPIRINHPREIYRIFVADIARPENASWLS
jgi:CRISPR-associated protein Cst2